MSLSGKPQITREEPIANDGFWPDLSLADLVSQYRIPDEYTTETVKTGLLLSTVRVNEQLQRARDAIELLGHAVFEDYISASPQRIGDEEVMRVHYRHAVYARAKAFLLQQFNSIKPPKNDDDSAMTQYSEQQWLDESQASIAAILRHFYPLENFTANSGVHVALI